MMHAPTIFVIVLLFLTLDHIRNGSRLQSPVPEPLLEDTGPVPPDFQRVRVRSSEKTLSRSINKIVYGNLGVPVLCSEKKRAKALRRSSASSSSPAPDAKAPAIVLLGAKKAGTSSLFRYLLANDGVRPPACKETGFWYTQRLGPGTTDESRAENERIVREWAAYFPLLPEDRFDRVSIEATPGYLYSCSAAAQLGALGRAESDLRSAAVEGPQKFVALLRNPTDRFTSDYYERPRAASCREWFEEGLSMLRQCVDASSRRQADEPWTAQIEETLACRPRTAGAATGPAGRGCAGLRRSEAATALIAGLYAMHLRHWAERVGREEIFVAHAEKLFPRMQRPVSEPVSGQDVVSGESAAAAAALVDLARLVRFLGLSMDGYSSDQRASLSAGGGTLRTGTSHVSGGSAAAADRAHDCPLERLEAFYQPHNAKLDALLHEAWPSGNVALLDGWGTSAWRDSSRR
jgi:hypothetical protein